MKIQNTFFLILIVCMMGLVSCGPNYVYENTIECGEEGWPFEKKLEATFEVPDSNTIYNLHLVLNHNMEFSYQNFYSKINTAFPNGELISEQVSLELARMNGQWLGDCSGESCELDILIQQGAFFNQLGQYKISIEQFSRQDPLKGIHSVSFRLEDTGERR